jgi:ABC-type sugar transport system permease subunit
LGLVGIPPQKWFLDLNLAMPSVVAVAIWGGFGYYMVLWLAALQGIPQELYDSAKVDGAEGVQLYWHVTVPLLRPTAAFILAMTTMSALQVFGSIYMLTGGGPVYRTTTITYHIYSQAFNFNHLGYASAVSVVLFLAILGVTLIQTRLMRWSQEIY